MNMIRSFLVSSLSFCAFMASGCATDLPAQTVEARYSSPASQFLELDDGVRLHVRDEGPRDAPVIILAHGSNASLHTWEPWVGSLKARWRVISFDFPAHGLTGPSRSGVYDGAHYVAVVDQLAQALKIERFVLGGNSMGGYVAWRYALAHPQKVAGLVLVNAAGYPRDDGKPPLVFRLARAPGVGEALSLFTNKSMLEANLKDVIVDDALVTPQMVQRYYDLLMRDGNRKATLARLRAPRDTPDAYQEIGRITAPTLILWGQKDPWIPVADGERFARDIKGSRLVVYPDVGHITHEETPKSSVGEVEAFLTQVYQRPAN
jgi:pimeloyl-ACP methyl ester carboxylesterase